MLCLIFNINSLVLNVCLKIHKLIYGMEIEMGEIEYVEREV